MNWKVAAMALGCCLPLLAAAPRQTVQVTTTDRVPFAAGGLIHLSGLVGPLAVEGWDEPVVEILRIHLKSESDLLKVALATGPSRGFARPGKYRKQYGGEDSYNGYDHQKLYEGKSSTATRFDPQLSRTCLGHRLFLPLIRILSMHTKRLRFPLAF